MKYNVIVTNPNPRYDKFARDLRWLTPAEIEDRIKEAPDLLDGQDFLGRTPLMHTIMQDLPVNFQCLLRLGANLDIARSTGATALHIAMQWDRDEMLRDLVNHGANLNPLDREGWTPLLLAADKGRMECVKLLLEAGADPGVVTRGGLTLGELIEGYLEFELAAAIPSYLRRYELMRSAAAAGQTVMQRPRY